MTSMASPGSSPAPVGGEEPLAQSRTGGGYLGRFKDLQQRIPVLQIVALLVLFGVGAATLPGFAGRSGIDAVLVLAAFLGIAAAGQTFVILIGGIDLSVPNIISGA